METNRRPIHKASQEIQVCLVQLLIQIKEVLEPHHLDLERVFNKMLEALAHPTRALVKTKNQLHLVSANQRVLEHRMGASAPQVGASEL